MKYRMLRNKLACATSLDIFKFAEKTMEINECIKLVYRYACGNML